MMGLSVGRNKRLVRIGSYVLIGRCVLNPRGYWVVVYDTLRFYCCARRLRVKPTMSRYLTMTQCLEITFLFALFH